MHLQRGAFMSFKNGKIFSYGHAFVPFALLLLFFLGNRDTSLLVVSGIILFWAVLLAGLAASDTPVFEIMGKNSYILYTVMDFALLAVAFAIPAWSIEPPPTWLAVYLISLYAFELGVARTLLFSLLSIVNIYIYCAAQPGAVFLSPETLVIILAAVLSLAFIGPTANRINRMAYYDSLTSLPNRRMFTEQLQASLAVQARRRSGALTGVLFLDVDGFKYINSTMGHPLGDQLLKAITCRLRKVLPKNVMLARIGGDEFALLGPIKTTDDAGELAQLLLRQFSASFSLDSQEVYATSSIGISVAPENGRDADTLMRNADTAMYQAKKQGRNNWQFYSDSSNGEGVERIRMETMLRHALERNEFVVYYQPRVETCTGKLVCVEALIRWIHPEQGMISPAEFIPLAEETGLIAPIGEQVLRMVCTQHKRWVESGLPPFRISVNLSARQFRQTELPEIIQCILDSTDMDPTLLELELTESAAMQDVNYAILMLRILKEMGLSIAIDDFGTGYSSLNYLKRFPLDVLKIDKSFTSGIQEDSDDAAIIRAIIAMGHSLKLSITAEGVETTAQRQYLEELGCDEIQGYLVGKPMAPEVLEQWYNLTFTGEGTIIPSA